MNLMKKLRISTALVAVGALALSGCARSEDGSEFPTRSIELVVPYPAGSGTDGVSRLLAEMVNESGELGERLQVVNKDGGNGAIGTSALANSKADGYTIGLLPDGPLTLVPHVEETAYDPADLELLTTVVETEMLVVVPASSPYKTWADLQSAATANPGKVTMGEGPLNYKVPLAMIEDSHDVDFKSIPFDSDGATTTSLLGKNVDAAMMQLAGALPQLKAGKLRALGVMSDEPSTLVPDVPTFASMGHDLSWAAFYVIAAPQDLDEDAREVLSEAITATLTSDAFVSKANALGMSVAASTPQEAKAAVDGKYELAGQYLK